MPMTPYARGQAASIVLGLTGNRGVAGVMRAASRRPCRRVQWSESGESGPEAAPHLGFHRGHQGRYHGGARRHPAPFRPQGRTQLPPRRPEMGGNDVRNRLLLSKLGMVRFTNPLLHPDIVRDRISVTPMDDAGGSELRRIPVSNRVCRTQPWIEREGVRWELRKYRGSPQTSGRAMYAQERAS